MRAQRKQIIAIVLLFLIAASFFPAVKADSPPVKVGFYPSHGFQNIDENGNLSGYMYDYLMEISQYTGWHYEFYTNDFDECLSMLEKGELDLLCGVQKTPERMEIFDFPTYPCAEMGVCLYVRNDDDRYAYEDFKSFDGMSVGIVRDRTVIQDLVAYCEKQGINVSLVEYASELEMLNALTSGMLDAVCTLNAVNYSGIRYVAMLSSNNSCYLMAPKGRTELLDELDSALYNVRLYKPNFEHNLWERYFPVIPGNSPMFSRAELEYIQSADTLNVLYHYNRPPLERFDEETETFDGVSAHVFQLISELSGLQFNFIPTKDHYGAIGFMDRSQIHIVSCTASDYRWSPNSNYRLTQSYLSVPLAMISRAQVPGYEMVIALPGGLYTSQLVRQNFSEYRIVEYPDFEAALSAILDGSATTTFANEHIARESLKNRGDSDLTVTSMSNLTVNYAIGVADTTDPLLLSIIDKTLSCISKDQVMEFLIEETMEFRTISFNDLLRQNPTIYMAILIGVFTVLLLLLFFIVLIKARHANELCRIANIDALTGAPTAYSFYHHAEKLLQASPHAAFIFLYVTIRKFKDVNTLYGYAFGDQMLQHLNQQLKAFCAEGETYGRIYADRFIILLKNTCVPELQARFSALNERMASFHRDKYSSSTFRLVGGAAPVPEGTRNIYTVIDQANCAYQQAMANPNLDFAFFTHMLADKMLHERLLENAMEKALDAGEFLVYYQPKIHSTLNKAVGAEALIRWQHAENGFLSPDEFIPLFEKNAFILKTDLFVFQKVCAYQADRQRREKPLYPISCNFSRLHLADPTFADTLAALADRYHVSHSLLEVEITETVAMEDMTRAHDQMAKLSEAGFSISIDDFGSGYSSLGIFSELNFNIVKIDRGLITNATATKNNEILLTGLIGILHSMNKTIVFEGVEQQDQVDFLRSRDCYVIQGYYYSKPLPEETFDEKY